MKTTKLWLLSAVFLFLIGNSWVFAGGGQQRTQGPAVDESRILNPRGQLPLLREPVTMTMGMIRSAVTADIVNNYKTHELQRDSNINLEFVFYGSSTAEARQRLEIEIMAGGTELPDIFNVSGLDPIAIGYYGSLGMFIPLNNYIENSAYWMLPQIAELPLNPWNFIRSADGNVYSLFTFSGEYVTEMVARMYINTAWLEEANLAMPRSTTEFENMLRAFQNRRPNADGRRTFPFIDIRENVRAPRFIAPLVGPFVYLGANNRWFYREPSGVASPVFVTEEWREALMWIRGMVDQGLIDPLSFTQDREQIMTIGSATNEYAFGASTFYPLNFIPLDDPRSDTWALMGPLSGPRGGDPVPTWSQNMPMPNFFITKNARYPEAAFRLGDLMMGEKFSVISRFGEEGVDWLRPGPGDRTYFEQYPPYLIPVLVWATPNNKLWHQNQGPRILPYRIFNGAYIYGSLSHLELWNAVATAQGMPYTNPFNSIGTIVYSMDEWERIGEIRANVENYFLESYIRFLLRDMSLENDWNRYLTELRSMGLDTYIQTFRTALTRMEN